MNRSRLTHVNEDGESRMVDVGAKAVTSRVALAEGFIAMPAALVREMSNLPKGNAYEVARVAGLMAAKKTAELIPLCHTLPLDSVSITFEPSEAEGRIRVLAEARCHGRTGVEMEAMTAVNIALLTLYDMGKAVARDMEIGPVRLLRKDGGKTGSWKRS